MPNDILVNLISDAFYTERNDDDFCVTVKSFLGQISCFYNSIHAPF